MVAKAVSSALPAWTRMLQRGRSPLASGRAAVPARLRLRATLVAAAAALPVACSIVTVPGPVSPPPVAPLEHRLRAGAARVDITPPPGAGLFGYGPEGKVSRGMRGRLYARALVLEDGGGERMALVTVDLGAISELVQRRAAAITDTAVGIGADRLLIAATHTHSGPGHFFGMSFDHFGTEVMGYEPRLVELLSRRIASAVIEATHELRPARIAWGMRPVWGLTRNRDLAAYELDAPAPARYAAPPGLPAQKAAVDPTWTMLRVDMRDADRVYRPAAAFSVFAMHGTGIPSANRLYDADLQGIIAAALERHMDATAGYPTDSTPRAVHLVANGAEGDVSADWPPETRCPLPQLKPGVDRSDFLALLDPALWTPDERGEARCLTAARRFVLAHGARLAAVADSMFDALVPTDSVAGVRRSFEVLRLTQNVGPLCPEPMVGTATAAGVADGVTRYAAAHVPTIEEGGTAVDPYTDPCQYPKRYLGGRAQKLLTSTVTGLPEIAQLTAVRIGHLVLLGVPAELTTTAGARERAAARAALGGSGARDSVAIVGLANGYMYYVTTPEEYALQHYAGGSTLYGPGTAATIASVGAGIVGQLPGDDRPSPPAQVGGFHLRTGAHLFRLLGGKAHLVPPADQGPAVPHFAASSHCTGDTLRFRWRDVYPGRLFRRVPPVLVVERRTANGWAPAAWDGDARIEVRADGAEGADGYWYEGSWAPPPDAPAGEYRVRYPEPGSAAARVTPTCTLSPAPTP